MGFSCPVAQLHDGSVPRGFVYTGVQLHGGSVTGVHFFVVWLHGVSVTRTLLAICP